MFESFKLVLTWHFLHFFGMVQRCLWKSSSDFQLGDQKVAFNHKWFVVILRCIINVYTRRKRMAGTWNTFFIVFSVQKENNNPTIYISILGGFMACWWVFPGVYTWIWLGWYFTSFHGHPKPTIWEDILNFFQIFSKHQTINMPPCFEKVNWHGDLSKFPTWGRHHSLSHIQWTKIIKRSPQGGTRPKLWGSVLIKEG